MIEIFESNSGLKVRFILGYKIKSIDQYYVKKFGFISTACDEKREVQIQELEKIANNSIEQELSKQTGILEFELTGVHLGEPYEVGEDGYNILGDWPVIGKMIVEYDKV